MLLLAAALSASATDLPRVRPPVRIAAHLGISHDIALGPARAKLAIGHRIGAGGWVALDASAASDAFRHVFWVPPQGPVTVYSPRTRHGSAGLSLGALLPWATRALTVGVQGGLEYVQVREQIDQFSQDLTPGSWAPEDHLGGWSGVRLSVGGPVGVDVDLTVHAWSDRTWKADPARLQLRPTVALAARIGRWARPDPGE